MPPVTFCLGATGSSSAPGRRAGPGALVGRLGAALGGVWLALGLLGCDSTQNVLITVQNLRTTGTVSVRTNYTLDSQPGKEGIARVAPPVDQFVLKFSGDQRGALTANVLAYTYVSPSECYVASTIATRMLDGSYKQDLAANLPTGVSVPCDASQ